MFNTPFILFFHLNLLLHFSILYSQAPARAEYERKVENLMSTNEIALELVKLSYKDALQRAGNQGNFDVEKIVTDLYNYILKNLDSEQNK